MNEEAGLGIAAVVGVLLTKAWDWFLNRRVDSAERTAEATLIEGLTARIVAIEARLAAVEADLDAARKDLAAEREAHAQTKAELMRLSAP